jgi:acyl-CoA thioester hydrolase
LHRKGCDQIKQTTKMEHQIQVRVRYSETDQMGIVYHGNYIPYFEMGRVEWLRAKGISYKSLEENGIGLPIVSMTLNYKKPARYDDLLTIKTIFKKLGSVKVEFDCEIWSAQNELLTTACFVLVFLDMKTGKAMFPPDYIKAVMNL